MMLSHQPQNKNNKIGTIVTLVKNELKKNKMDNRYTGVLIEALSHELD